MNTDGSGEGVESWTSPSMVPEKSLPRRTPVKLRPSPDVGGLVDCQRTHAVLKT
jgi:hypothetical protein